MKKKLNTFLCVGLGGAGQRHLRLLKSLCPQAHYLAYRSRSITPLLHTDFSVNPEDTVERHYELSIVDSLKQGYDEHPDCVVIATPSSLHEEPLLLAAEAGCDIIVEKPFATTLDSFDRIKNAICKHQSRFLVSFQRRFHPLITELKALIEQKQCGDILSISIDVASYVPAWHPYEDFKQLYACQQSLGGGVLFTECHELDWCCWMFGLPKTLYCSAHSHANLDVEDTVHLILNYDTFSISLTLSFMTPVAKRHICINGSNASITCDLISETLTTTHLDQTPSSISSQSCSNDDLFIKQALFFLNHFTFDDSLYYLQTAYQTTHLLQLAHQSLKNQSIMEVVPYENHVSA